jgi:hypothetical protein
MLKNNGFHNRHSPFSRPFSPASFFANGEQGWWYDPSNFATLFQDSAGTTPVTAVEQPVGLQLDLSGRGNHRFQATSANRPVVSARVNLFVKTEQFDSTEWPKSNVTVTANTIVAPDGTTTADTLLTSTGGGYLSRGVSAASSTLSIYVKQGVGSRFSLGTAGVSGDDFAVFNLSTGSVISTGANNLSASITSVGDGWYRLVVARGATAGNSTIYIGYLLSSASANDFSYIWGADLRPTNQGVDLPVYQRVNTSTDYDSTGFPVYIKPNGSNQFMQTNSIDFSATDKMTVWQGVRKLRDTAQSMIAELSATILLNNGTFLLTAPDSIAANYNFSSKGTTQVDNVVTTYTSPITNVLVGIGDISGSINSVKVNGGAATTVTSSQGTGNYSNNPAYFYMRAGLTLPFNGNDYGSIARGAASTAEQITNGETYINSLTKAYTP